MTVPALNDFAVLLLETKRPREAEAIARRATELNGRLAAAWDTLATALVALDRHDEAYAAMEKAMAAEGAQDPRIQLHWARMLYQRGDREPAKEAAEKAHAERLQLNPREREELLRLRDKLKLDK
jgi:tetratricopeptide (TPR) repeat protein